MSRMDINQSTQYPRDEVNRQKKIEGGGRRRRRVGG
jgi:hypothetical protein